MSTEQALILRDVAGSYYVIPPAVLEANRAPADQQQALQETLDGEVSGYIAYLTTPDRAPVTPGYGYNYSYGPNGYSYGYWYTLPGLPAPGPFRPDPRNV